MKNIYKILFFIIIIIIVQQNVYGQSCLGFPTGTVQTGNDMNYSPECSPVTAVWEVWFKKVDDGGDPNNIAFRFDWGDGTIETIPYDGVILTNPSANRYDATITHIYPTDNTLCSYDLIVNLVVDGEQCSAIIELTVFAWDTDDDGSGELRLENENDGDIIYYICEGKADTIRFLDNSTLNCNLGESPLNPNSLRRWVQFQYGTFDDPAYAGDPRIPNLKVGATQVTDAGGNLIFDLNGDLLTRELDGAVTIYDPPAAVPPSGYLTDQVIVPAGVTSFGEVFEIRMRYWNYCNQYDDGVAPPPGVDGDNPPVTITAIIEIITTPPDVGDGDFQHCIGDDLTVSVTPAISGRILWYADSLDAVNGVDSIFEGQNFDPTNIPIAPSEEMDNLTPGSNTYWVTEKLASCESLPSEVVVTVRNELSVTGGISGPTVVCANENNVIFSVANDPPPMTYGGATEYVWAYPGFNYNSGQGTKSLDVDAGAADGAYTIEVYLQYATDPRCPSTSKTHDVDINELPTAEITTTTVTVCNGDNADLSIDLTGEGNGDWVIQYNVNGAPTETTPTINATPYTLTILAAELTISGANTVTLTSVTQDKGKVCTGSILGAAATVNNNDLPTATITSGNATICDDNDVDITLALTGHGVGDWVVEYTVNGVPKTSLTIDVTPYDLTILAAELTNIGANTVVLTGVTQDKNAVCTGSIVGGGVTITNNALPTAEFTLTTDTICDGEDANISVDLTGHGAGNWVLEYKINAGGLLFTPVIAATPYILVITDANLILGDNIITLLGVTQDKGASAPCVGTINPAKDTILIRKNELPTAAVTTANYNICEGYDADIDIDMTGEIGGNWIIEYQINAGISQFTALFDNDPYTLTISAADLNLGLNTITLIDVTQDVGVAVACDGSIVFGSEDIDITVDQLPTVSNAGVDQEECDPVVIVTMDANVAVIGTGTWDLVSKPPATPDPGISNVNSEIATITIADPNWGIYTYDWVINNGTCPDSHDTVTIDFGAAPTIDAGLNDAVCYPDYTLAATNSSGTGLWSKFAGPGNEDFDDDTDPNATVTVDADGIYTFRWTVTSGACAPVSDDVDIQFYPLPNITSQPANTETCNLGNASFSVTATGPALTYQWQVDDGLGFVNASGGVYTNDITATLNITAAGVGMNGYFYRCIVQEGTNSCDIISDTATLTVHVYPNITADPVAAEICDGADTSFSVTATGTTLTYQWQEDPGGGFVDLTNGGFYSNVTTSTLNITGATTAMDTYQYQCIVTESTLCPVTSGSAVLTVHTYPNITTHPVAAEICDGADTSFTVAVSGTTLTYQWQEDPGGGFVDLTNGGFYSNVTTSTLNITGATIAMDTYQYQCIVTESGLCPSTSGSAILTVHAYPNITANPVAAEICDGADTSFTVAVSGTTLTYQWQEDPGGGFVDLTNGGFYSNVTTSTLNITGATTAMDTYQYQCIVTESGLCPSTSGSAVLTVHAYPNITADPVAAEICNGADTSFSVTATGPTLTYQWQEDPGGGFVDLTNGGFYSNVTTSTLNITGATTAMDTYQYQCIVTESALCPVTSGSAILTVHAYPNITTHPVAAEICDGADTSFTVVVSGTTLTYQWQENDGGGFLDLTNGGFYSNVTTLTLNITGATTAMDTYLYRCIITESGLCPTTSGSAILTVHPYPNITTNPANAAICDGANTSFTVAATGTTLTYQWQVDKQDAMGFNDLINDAIYSNVTAATLNIAGATIAMDTYQYQCIVTESGLCPVNSAAAVLTVHPLPTITSQPTDISTCVGDNTSFSILPNSAGDFTYQWQLNSGSGFNDLANDATYNNVTTATLNISSVNITLNGYLYRCLIDSINTSCQNISDEVTLTVNSLPVITSQPNDVEICENANTTFGILPDDIITYSYQWQVDKQDAMGFNDLFNDATYNNVATATLDITGATIAMDNYQYLCIITNKSTTCEKNSSAALLEIKLLPVTSAISGQANVCAGAQNVSYQVDQHSGSTYAWIIPPEFTAAGGTVNFGGSPNRFVSLNYGAATFSGVLKVVETNNGCDGDTITLDIQAYDLPIADAGNDTTICNGDAAIIGGNPSASNGSGTYIYEWTPTSYLDDATIANPSASPPLSLNYSLKVTDGSSGCISTTDNIQITVNAVPDAPIAPNKTFCESETIEDLTASGENISWYDDITLLNLITTGSPFATGETTPFTYQYYVTQTVDNCESDATPVSLTINATPDNITADDTTICYGEPTPALITSGSSPHWYSNPDLTGLVYIGNTYNPTVFAVGVYTYYLVDEINGCQSEPDTVVLTINAKPLAPNASDTTICYGNLTPDMIATGETGSTIEWFEDPGLTNLLYTGSVFITGETEPKTYTYYVTQTVNSCQSPLKTVKLTINPSPTITQVNYIDENFCGSEDGTISISASGTYPLEYSIDNGANYLENGNFTGLGSGLYYTSVKNYYGCRIDGDTVTITSGNAPEAPDAGDDAIYCDGDNIVSLYANISAGGYLTWYSDGATNDSIGTGNSFTPYNNIDTTYYYVTETTDTCESPPTAVEIIIYEIPQEPQANDTAVCFGEQTPELVALGNNIRWYYPSPSQTDFIYGGDSLYTGQTNVNPYTYYVTQTINGCESSYKPVVLTINTMPSAPASSDVTRCYGQTIPALEATGTNINWYDNSDLLNSVYSGDTYDTEITESGIYTYYVTETLGDCESEATEVILTINEIPNQPEANDVSICDGDIVPDLTAIGLNIVWYSEPELINIIGNNSPFSTTQSGVSDSSYYVTQTVNNCESLSDTVTLTINALPPIPDADDLTICYGDDAILHTTGTNPNWFDGNEFGNPFVYEGNHFVTGKTEVDDYTYYVTDTVNGCGSGSKTVTLIINPTPEIISNTSTNESFCNGNDGTITIDAFDVTGLGLTYSIDGVNFSANNYFDNLRHGNYPVIVKNTYDCEIYGDTLVVTAGENAPDAPVAGDNADYCFGETMVDLTAVVESGGYLVWYSDPLLLDSIATGETFVIPDTDSIGTIYYYVTQKNDTCEGPSTNIQIVVNPNPEIYTLTGDEEYCANINGVTIELDSSTFLGINYQLYKDDAVDGSFVEGTGNTISWQNNHFGTYHIIATDISSGCWSAMNDTLTVIKNSLPDPTFSADVTEGCSPLSVNFNRYSIDPALYIWDFGDGVIDSITEDPMHVFDNSTNFLKYYEVRLTAVTGKGCRDSVSDYITVFPLPDYDFTIAPDSACHPATVQLTSSPGGSSYVWDFGNGPMPGQFSVTNVFNNTTDNDIVFPIRLIATSAFSCEDTIDKQLVVFPKPEANFYVNPTVGCSPHEVTIVNYSSQNVINYYWNYGDNSGIDETSSPEFTKIYENLLPYEADYELSLIVETENGCTDESDKKIVKVYPEVTADFLPDVTSGCDPLTINLIDRSFGHNSILNYWDFGDGQTISGPVSSHVFNNSTSADVIYPVLLIAQSNYNCVDSFTMNVAVYPSPEARFVVTPMETTYPDTEFEIINASSSGSWTYGWDLGDGNTEDFENSYTHQYDTSGSYTIILTVSGEHCTDDTSVTVVVRLPAPIIYIGSDTAGCAPLTVQFTNTTIYAEKYLWDFGDGGTSTKKEPAPYTYTDAGTYYVYLLAYGPESFTDTDEPVTVEVYQNPVAKFSVVSPVAYIPDKPVAVVNESYNAFSYRWVFGTDSSITDKNAVYYFDEPGIYDITLIAYSEDLCIDTLLKVSAVKVEDTGGLSFMNAFQPNASSGTDGSYSTDGFDRSIFFPVMPKGVVKYQLQIFNRWGEIIFETKDIAIGWNGRHLNKGPICDQDVYFWKATVTYSDGRNSTIVGDITLLR